MRVAAKAVRVRIWVAHAIMEWHGMEWRDDRLCAAIPCIACAHLSELSTMASVARPQKAGSSCVLQRSAGKRQGAAGALSDCMRATLC